MTVINDTIFIIILTSAIINHYSPYSELTHETSYRCKQNKIKFESKYHIYKLKMLICSRQQ
jgi:hypothetical protein